MTSVAMMTLSTAPLFIGEWRGWVQRHTGWFKNLTTPPSASEEQAERDVGMALIEADQLDMLSGGGGPTGFFS